MITEHAVPSPFCWTSPKHVRWAISIYTPLPTVRWRHAAWHYHLYDVTSRHPIAPRKPQRLMCFSSYNRACFCIWIECAIDWLAIVSVEMPPAITAASPKLMYYRIDVADAQLLECAAVGSPGPTLVTLLVLLVSAGWCTCTNLRLTIVHAIVLTIFELVLTS
jgi:hypothetical protein